jgi:5-methylcytosine-specific restriction endonuclease McrA
MPTVDKLNEPVLILNVNYEPLNVCNTKRALALVFKGKADILLNGRGKIRSATAEYDIPSVIKLEYMVKRPRLQVSLTKREILRRDEFTCQYCGRKTRVLTIDHVTPRRLGGAHTWTNVVAACPPCNRRKGGKMFENANMRLRRPPFQPSASAQYRFGHHLASHQEWEQFIQGW